MTVRHVRDLRPDAHPVALGGRYAELYRSWLGNTGQTED